jgi:hypothetical protein
MAMVKQNKKVIFHSKEQEKLHKEDVPTRKIFIIRR